MFPVAGDGSMVCTGYFMRHEVVGSWSTLTAVTYVKGHAQVKAVVSRINVQASYQLEYCLSGGSMSLQDTSTLLGDL